MVAYQEALGDFESEGVAVIAGSTDDPADAAETVAKLGLTFPVAAGLPLLETASALGAFYEERRQILHATGFVVRPGGAIAGSCYSSGPVGRIEPIDALRLVRFYKARS